MLQNEKKEIKKWGDGIFFWCGLKAKDEKIAGKINKNQQKPVKTHPKKPLQLIVCGKTNGQAYTVTWLSGCSRAVMVMVHDLVLKIAALPPTRLGETGLHESLEVTIVQNAPGDGPRGSIAGARAR
jgi:hypothetical protein